MTKHAAKELIVNEPITELLWNTRQAAAALGISERTLWSLTFGRKKDGVEQVPPEKRIPHVRVGNRVHYDPDDLRGWIKRNKQGVSSNPDSSC